MAHGNDTQRETRIRSASRTRRGSIQEGPDELKWPKAPVGANSILSGMAPPLRAWTRGLAVVLGLCTGTGVPAGGLDRNPCSPPPQPGRFLEATVRRVIDGDTVVVQPRGGRQELVRLIGVDTPEVQASEKFVREMARTGRDATTLRRLGRRAAAFTTAWLPPGRRVGLELDVERRDRNERLLAYVWRADGILVNLALLEVGQAQLLTIPPNVRHADRFQACAAAARAARRGLWASADGRGR
jgi:endonuclease YncB( thermonuclease family)